MADTMPSKNPTHERPCTPHVRWSQEEDDLMRRTYPVLGGAGTQRAFFSDRTLSAVYSRAKKLKLSSPEGENYWTEHEISTVQSLYPSLGAEVLHEKYLKKHSVCDIRKQAKALDLHKPRTSAWTEEELNILHELYPQMGVQVSAYLPNRSVHAIHKLANRLELKGPSTAPNAWTEEEDDIIRVYYPANGRDICAMLPNRTMNAVRRRAQVLGVKTTKIHEPEGWRWTEEEEALLREKYPILGRKAVTFFPNRSYHAVLVRARLLGLPHPTFTTRQNSWREAEDNLIRELYPANGAAYVHSKLPLRTANAIRTRARAIGVRRTMSAPTTPSSQASAAV